MKRLLISLVLLAVWSGALAFDPLASEARLAALPPPGQVPLDAELVGGPECPAQGFVGGGPISLAEVVKRGLLAVLIVLLLSFAKRPEWRALPATRQRQRE